MSERKIRPQPQKWKFHIFDCQSESLAPFVDVECDGKPSHRPHSFRGGRRERKRSEKDSLCSSHAKSHSSRFPAPKPGSETERSSNTKVILKLPPRSSFRWTRKDALSCATNLAIVNSFHHLASVNGGHFWPLIAPVLIEVQPPGEPSLCPSLTNKPDWCV